MTMNVNQGEIATVIPVYQLRILLFLFRIEDTAIRSEIEGTVRQLNNLKAARSNTLKRFGGYMPQLLQAIDAAFRAGKFHLKPRGPIGKITKTSRFLSVAGIILHCHGWYLMSTTLIVLSLSRTGANIKLRDQRWALGIESCLKSQLIHSFCVNDHHDEKELEKILTSVCPKGKKPTIITSMFMVSARNFLLYYCIRANIFSFSQMSLI